MNAKQSLFCRLAAIKQLPSQKLKQDILDNRGQREENRLCCILTSAWWTRSLDEQTTEDAPLAELNVLPKPAEIEADREFLFLSTIRLKLLLCVVLCRSLFNKEGGEEKMPAISDTAAAAAASTLISSAAEIIYGLSDAFFFSSSSQQLLSTTKAAAIHNSAAREAGRCSRLGNDASKKDGHWSFALSVNKC